jgi:hypothetical protein
MFPMLLGYPLTEAGFTLAGALLEILLNPLALGYGSSSPSLSSKSGRSSCASNSLPLLSKSLLIGIGSKIP